ncbi:MAG: hypothetical protein ACREX8_19600, partial [Gammaproteobacteria bacterium]
NAAAALVGGATHPRDKFVRSTPCHLRHACMLAGVTSFHSRVTVRQSRVTSVAALVRRCTGRLT